MVKQQSKAMYKINNAGNISCEKREKLIREREKLIKELKKPPLKRWGLG